ncbi:MAG TPA: GIY-YIG nuclease family protein [Patescibacteria group bacterium]|nr:GIY-YIG nuclease family protein [Patescibacteria group bacterium]
MWYFYIIQSLKDDNWFYKGSTNDLSRRIRQHNNGEVFSSRFYKPFKLVYYEAYLSEKAARERERSVKRSGSVWMPLMKRIKKSLK